MEFHATYLQRRQPGVSYRDFQRLWRSHGDFAATVTAFWDNVTRYIHNDPIEDATGLPGQTGEYDAIGELYYPSYETWSGMRDVMWNEVAPDEKRVFSGPSTAVRGARTVFREPAGLYKLFTFARFPDRVVPQDAEAILARHAAATLAAPGFSDRLSGFTVTQARPPEPGSGLDSKPQTASNMDVLFIHHFDDEAAARAAMTSPAYATIRAAEAEFLEADTRLAVLTHGWVLKGAEAIAAGRIG